MEHEMDDLDDKDTMILFFDVCAKIEGLCAELYHFYSDVFQIYGEASQLWKKTALEEENHKRQFEFASRLLNEAEFELETDVKKAFRVYHKFQNLLEHVRTNPPDIATALSKAIEMEEHLADLHMESSIQFGNQSMKEMFQAMKDFDQEHVKSLKNFLSVIMLPKTEMIG
jgi:rubrerythrin